MQKSDSPEGIAADPAAPDVPPATKQSKVIVAAVMGTAMEFYDFALYGYMATFLSVLFFAETDDTTALLATFGAFAAAFVMRIPGGIFFGHFGDKYGRKRALTWTLVLMAAATFLMGLLPGYVTLGIWATVLLVVLRCLQGFAAGGELSGASAFVTESAPARHRGFQTSMVNAGGVLGALTAALAGLILTSVFSEEVILEWAWRIPFLLSVALGLTGLWIRTRLDETPQFKKLQAADKTSKYPIVELFRSAPRNAVTICFMNFFITGGHYFATVFSASYLTREGGQTAQTAFLSTVIALSLGVVVLPLAGALSDRVGRKPVIFFGTGLAALLGLPLFMLMADGATWQAMLAHSLLVVFVQIASGASFVAWAEMLSASVRYTGIAFGNNVGNTLLGGSAPLIATFLVVATGNRIAPVAFYIGCALVSLVAATTIAESKGSKLGVW